MRRRAILEAGLALGQVMQRLVTDTLRWRSSRWTSGRLRLAITAAVPTECHRPWGWVEWWAPLRELADLIFFVGHGHPLSTGY